MRKIDFLDLGLQHQQIHREIFSAISRIVKKKNFILGDEVGFFEKEFSGFCGTRYAAGVSSGTSALFLALRSLGIKEGDEVIVPSFTYIATAFSVSYTGATPRFVDINESTYNIDVDKIKKAVNKNTKAIIPVHLFGQPADMQGILKIAQEYNLKIIEDAAQAHGAKIKLADGEWHNVGSIGNSGCFSFYPSKNLGGFGDGGMLVTNDKEIYKKIILLRNCGRISKYEHSIIGYNERLDTLQAAILRVKLRKLSLWNELRREAALLYTDLLKEVDGIITPYVLPSAQSAYHVYAVRVKKKRDALLKRFAELGIQVIVYYPVPLHLQKAYASLGYKKGDLPISERVAKEIISLPIYPYLKEKQIKFVVEAMKGI